MTQTLLELAYQRRKTRTQAAELLDKAVADGRSLSVAEQVKFDSLLTNIHELDAAISARAALRKA